MAWAAAAMAGAQAAGATVGGISAYQQSRAQAKTLRKLGHEDARDREREAAQLLAKQRVAFAKAGVDPGTGSALDVQAATAAQERLAVQRVLTAYQRAARLSKKEGSSALISGLLLGGGQGASAYGKYSGGRTQLGSSARGTP